jgi:hypothetical protein
MVYRQHLYKFNGSTREQYKDELLVEKRKVTTWSASEPSAPYRPGILGEGGSSAIAL